MPNSTDEIRAMISLGYTRVFPHAHERLPLPTENKVHLLRDAQRVKDELCKLKTPHLWELNHPMGVAFL